MVQVNSAATLTSLLVPFPTTGKFKIRQQIKLVTKWMDHSKQYTFDATSIIPWKYSVSLKSFETGALTSDVAYSVEKHVLTSDIISKGVPSRGDQSNQTAQDKEDWAKDEKLLLRTIENRMPSSMDFTSKINEGLNGQKSSFSLEAVHSK
jgi:hypothetical protein